MRPTRDFNWLALLVLRVPFDAAASFARTLRQLYATVSLSQQLQEEKSDAAAMDKMWRARLFSRWPRRVERSTGGHARFSVAFRKRLKTHFFMVALCNRADHIYLLGEEASPSIGNTLWRVSTMFTRSV